MSGYTGADPAFRLCDFTGKRNLTCQTAVTLKHSLHIGLAALERVQIPDENPGIHRLWVLRIGLVAHFAHLHRLEQKNVTGCRFILERDSGTTNATSKSDTVRSFYPFIPNHRPRFLPSLSSRFHHPFFPSFLEIISKISQCKHAQNLQIKPDELFNYLIIRDTNIDGYQKVENASQFQRKTIPFYVTSRPRCAE